MPRDLDLSYDFLAAKAERAGWERPIPFHEADAPPFPTDALPAWWRQFVEATAVATQTPADMAAVLSLASVATCAHGRLRVDVKPGYSEPLNLYIACVMDPGNRKSAVVRAITEPIAKFESEEAQRLASEVEAAQSQRRIDEKRLARAEDEASRSDSLDERRTLEETAKQLAAELASRPRLYAPRLLVDDVTPEQLATLLTENSGRMAVLAAEGTIFELMCGRYDKNGSPNLGLFLNSHAGDPIRVDRRSRPAERIERPAVTIGVAVQPEVIRGLMGNNVLRGRGLLARFLYSVPSSFVGRRDVDPPAVASELEARYGDGLGALLSMRVPENAAIDLSREALREFVAYSRRIEARVGPDGDLHHIQDWANKLAGAVARIAALLHVTAHASNSPWTLPIDATTMQAATRVGDYFTAHALAAFAEMGADPALEHGKALRRWLQRRGEPSFSKREAFNALRSRFRRVQAIDPAIDLLTQHGCIRIAAEEPMEGGRRGRPPSPVFEVNPFLFVSTQKAHKSQNSVSAHSAVSASTGAA